MLSKLYLPICLCLLFISCQKDTLEPIEDIDVQTPENVAINIPLEVDNESSIDSVKNWISQMQQPSGLLESAEHTDFVSLYDNALAAIFFIQDNQQERAEKIFDFYNTKVQSELYTNGGFYQFRNITGKEGERVWMGDNAWLLIALNHYEKAYNSSKYELMAQELESWLRSLQNEDGSLDGGLNADGTEIPKVTEGIITAFNAVRGFDDFHKDILKFLEAKRWDAQQKLLMAWPENPAHAYALDLHSLGSSIFQGFAPEALLQAERYLTEQEVTLSGKKVSGYCFDEDRDVIWLEGTAQMAVAFTAAAQQETSQQIIATLEKTFIKSTTIANAKGIPYTTNHGTSYGTSLLWDHADIAPALSSTIWYLFAKESFNPLSLGAQKDIPNTNKFWLRETID